MRDTEVLRRRLWAQIGLPLATAALLSACDSGSSTARKPADGGKQARPNDSLPTAPPEGATKTNAPVAKDGTVAVPARAKPAGKGYVPPGSLDEIPDGEFDYYGPARDPFGDHPEEEGCPSGDWCGPPEEARKYSIEGAPERLDCPTKIIAHQKVTAALDQDGKVWEGFSFHPMMQGRLMSSETAKTRESSGDAQTCCYHWFEYCSGRPLRDGDRMVVAELQDGATWSCDASEVAAPDDRPDAKLSAALRARLGELWIEDARMEHASIAAFMRVTLELMAMAAPSELLAEVQQAAQDEVEHAQRCFGLAARFSGRQREPGVLPTLEPRVSDVEAESDWVRLAVDTFIEGCVGETIAALVARRGLRRCEDPATFHTLEQITDDEGRHAGLAWRTISWVLASCGEHRDAVLAAVRALAEEQAEVARAACLPEALPEADADSRALANFGRLDRRGELLAIRDAWEELILPTLEAVAPSSGGPGSEAWA